MKLLTIFFSLLVPFSSIASPLLKSPYIIDVNGYLEIEDKTFLCFCDYSPTTGRLDTSGCATDGRYATVGNIITPSQITHWLPEGMFDDDITASFLNDTIKTIMRDPLNLTVFSDKVYPSYYTAKVVTGTNEIGGKLGACPFERYEDKVKINDGRLGEYARTALYIKKEYGIPIPDKTLEHLRDMSKAAFITEREHYRNKGAYRWNKSWNEYVSKSPDNRVPKAIQKGIVDYINQTSIWNE